MLIVCEKEAEQGLVSVRQAGSRGQGADDSASFRRLRERDSGQYERAY